MASGGARDRFAAVERPPERPSMWRWLPVWRRNVRVWRKLLGPSLLGNFGDGAAIVDWVEQRANLAHCAVQCGVTEEAMKRTAAYVSEREQFGVPLGSFQALAMRMADAYIDVEAIRSVRNWRFAPARRRSVGCARCVSSVPRPTWLAPAGHPSATGARRAAGPAPPRRCDCLRG